MIHTPSKKNGNTTGKNIGRTSQALTTQSQEDVLPLRKQEFAFIQDMADLLELANATYLDRFASALRATK